tara:strand:- start:2669 stop:2857 length:189 start_codon:yes stop_codon:yes gene_type:complete
VLPSTLGVGGRLRLRLGLRLLVWDARPRVREARLGSPGDLFLLRVAAVLAISNEGTKKVESV